MEWRSTTVHKRMTLFIIIITEPEDTFEHQWRAKAHEQESGTGYNVELMHWNFSNLTIILTRWKCCWSEHYIFHSSLRHICIGLNEIAELIRILLILADFWSFCIQQPTTFQLHKLTCSHRRSRISPTGMSIKPAPHTAFALADQRLNSVLEHISKMKRPWVGLNHQPFG